jgi:hypothetical protein
MEKGILYSLIGALVGLGLMILAHDPDFDLSYVAKMADKVSSATTSIGKKIAP